MTDRPIFVPEELPDLAKRSPLRTLNCTEADLFGDNIDCVNLDDSWRSEELPHG